MLGRLLKKSQKRCPRRAQQRLLWDRTPRQSVCTLASQGPLDRLSQGVAPEQAGLTDENSNGNGSLMRILPVALCYFGQPASVLMAYAHRVSSLTHRHVRCQMSCGIYCSMISALLGGAAPKEAYLRAIRMDCVMVMRLVESPPSGKYRPRPSGSSRVGYWMNPLACPRPLLRPPHRPEHRPRGR